MGLLPAMGDPHDKQQPGTDEISELELLVNGQLCELFGGAWADARIQSCTYANAAVYAAFSKPGDAIASIAAEDGGHVSHHGTGTVGLLGRKNVALAYRGGAYDDDLSAVIIAREQPTIVMLGASVVFEPFQLVQTIRAARAIGALLVYDASHVAGLIGGKAFQNPMEMGFDIMTASTYKTLCGPPGGILVGSNAAHGERLRQHIVGGWTSNYDASRLAGLSIALAEATLFMSAYARRMIDNAQQLSVMLNAAGIEALVSGLPGNEKASSHHIVIPFKTSDAAAMAAKEAERSGVYIGTARVPGRTSCGGLRIGTQIITRQGANEHDLEQLAECLRIIITKGSDERVRQRVREIAGQLNECLFCFD